MTSGRIGVVGKGDWLTVKEAMQRLEDGGCPASDTTVRAYVSRGLLRAHWTGGGHTRIETKSVDELIPALKIPPGPERDAALEELRRRNRGEDV